MTVSAVSVLSFGLNPCWCLLSSFFDSKYSTSWVATIFSSILENIGNREMGR